MAQLKRRSLDVVRATMLISALVVPACSTEQHSPRPAAAPVQPSLAAAGANREVLTQVLEHYRGGRDPQKIDAAHWLIANMQPHGFILTAFYDKNKVEVPFDALDYKTFAEAQARLDELEKDHPGLDFARKRFDADLEHITSELLIENIDLAFEAWRTKPWAKAISFDTFRDYILPYRGSNEPLNSTRPAILAAFANLPSRMKNPADMEEAYRLIDAEVNTWAAFSELYYLHPTDQSYEEIRAHKLGRCEDLTNLKLYAMRANAIPVAQDYTPWWADRDNNHAWEVRLDADGKGHAGLSNRAAKVYRKMYATQPGSLGAIRGEEAAPGWLAGKTYLDVTDQYVPVADVTVAMTVPAPEGKQFAYVYVFNGGEWRAIDWAKIEASSGKPKASFHNLGRNIAYLPGYFADDKLVPAAEPFILDREGRVHSLKGDAASITMEITTLKPATPDADTKRDKPSMLVEKGRTYELFAWIDGEWKSQGSKAAGEEPVSFESVPGNRLYWMKADNSRGLERIFTIENGKQVWW